MIHEKQHVVQPWVSGLCFLLFFTLLLQL